MNDATVVEYSLIVDVAMDGLHTRLDPDTFVIGERGHRGSIGGINDASSYIIMEKVSPTLLPIVSISSEAHDLGIRARDIGESVGSDQPSVDQLLSLASLAASRGLAVRLRFSNNDCAGPQFASRLRRADGTEDI
jgi:hypothetical protein